ncbi:MAG: glycosyltransferase family 39 protein [Saprospiraceae bacterium]
MKKTVTGTLWLFTGLFLAAMFLPRLAPQGLFGDGLLYASMARNLAEGKGSMWAPWFSSGYWLEFASGAPYFENPPLMLWLQAGFFHLFGDHWWVEKLYSLLLFVLNAWLIVRAWEVPLRGTVYQKRFGWIPLLCWYFTMPAIWGNPNNLMDNNLLGFCLLALWIGLEGMFAEKSRNLPFLWAGAVVFLGLMTKGPVGLYPAAAPFLLVLAQKATSQPARYSPGTGLWRSCLIGFTALALFVIMLLLIPESQHYFEQYWQRRLGVVLSGVREDAEMTGWARLHIFRILVKEQAGLIGLFLLLYFFYRRSRMDTAFRRERMLALFFLFMGFAATLPIMLSARQNGIYVIPGMPMFALAAGFFYLPFINKLLLDPTEAQIHFFGRLRVWLIAGVFVLAAYTAFLFGKPGRDNGILHDLPYLQRIIPAGSTVAVCEGLMYNQQAHTYLQRFHHLELSPNIDSCRFALASPRCDISSHEDWESHGFIRADSAEFPGKAYILYERTDK